MTAALLEFMIFRLPLLLLAGTIAVYGARLAGLSMGFGKVLYPDETESGAFWRSFGFLSFNAVLRIAAIIAAFLLSYGAAAHAPQVLFGMSGPSWMPFLLLTPLALVDVWALIAGGEMLRRNFILPLLLVALPVCADLWFLAFIGQRMMEPGILRF